MIKKSPCGITKSLSFSSISSKLRFVLPLFNQIKNLKWIELLYDSKGKAKLLINMMSNFSKISVLFQKKKILKTCG